MIVIREKPNLDLELYLRLASVWKHTARLRIRVWINCVIHEVNFQPLHPDTDALLHKSIQSSHENREHSAACSWLRVSTFATGKIRGQLFVEMSLMRLFLFSLRNVATLL